MSKDWVNDISMMHRKYATNIAVRRMNEEKLKEYLKFRINFLYEELTWQKNQAKWKFAEEYCIKNDWEFKILTERELQPHK